MMPFKCGNNNGENKYSICFDSSNVYANTNEDEPSSGEIGRKKAEITAKFRAFGWALSGHAVG